MTDFSNTQCEPFTPSAYRKARQLMHAFPRNEDPPLPQIDTLMYTDPHVRFDFQRLMADDPELAQTLKQSEEEDGMVIPPDIEEGLIARGYIFWRDEDSA